MTDVEGTDVEGTEADVDLGGVDAGTPDAPAGRSPGLVLAISLAVVFALAAATLGVVAARAGDGADGRVESLRDAAGEVAQALFTYDFEDPEAHKERILSLATGSFRGEYADAFDQGLGELITKVQATSEGFVKEVYVSEIDDERAEAVVVSDVTRNGAGGERTLYDIYIRLTFVDVDGTWKVDQVTDLNFATEGAQPGATATSTPVP